MSVPRGGQFGPYRLLAPLSEGGSGEVWLATIPGTGEPVVIKRLRPHLRDRPQLILRLKHEAKIAVLLDDPRIVRVLDVGEVGGEVYLCMEYVAGWTLGQLLQATPSDSSRLTISAAIGLSMELLRGLMVLHTVVDPETREPLMAVHRDVAPRNVMVQATGGLKIIDLGLGKSNIQDWTTRMGATLGTPGYMAPEQVLGRPCDQRTDLYSAFVLCFEMLVGERYVQRGSTQEMIERCLAGAYRPLSQVRPGLDPRIDPIFERALALRPDERFPNVQEALRALEAVCGKLEAPTRGELPTSFQASTASLLTTAQNIARASLEPLLDVSGMTVYARRVEATVTAPAITSTLDTAATSPGAPSSGRLTPLPSPPTYDRRPGPRQRPWTTALLVLSAVALGMAVGVLWRRSPEAIPTAQLRAQAPSESKPEVTAARREVQVEEVVPPAPPTPAPSPTDAGSRGSKVRGAKVPPPPTVTLAPEPRAPGYADLMLQTAALRQARPELAPEVDALITDASLWQRSPSGERSRRALDELWARLHRLQQRR